MTDLHRILISPGMVYCMYTTCQWRLSGWVMKDLLDALARHTKEEH
jgi:predicted Rdx family selenoprotein